MTFSSILVANRGEIALRVARCAAELGMGSVAVYAADDADSRHVSAAGSAVGLSGTGPRAYLDIEGIVAAARAAGCDAVHPGYGFLSENPALAAACRNAGLVFVGPPVSVLELCGDKARARVAARAAGVPVLEGSNGAVTLEQAQSFFAGLPAGASRLIKAIGGGGRGMGVVHDAARVSADGGVMPAGGTFSTFETPTGPGVRTDTFVYGGYASSPHYDSLVAKVYENGKALNQASLFGIDDTIDPADSRRWVVGLLKSMRTHPKRGKKRPAVDAW